MKILSMQVENAARIIVAEVRPTDNLVEITGGNDDGKTSLLNAICWAFAGKAAMPDEPIRRGAEQAAIAIDCGDLKVTRRINRQDDGSYTQSVVLENADGNRLQKPQAVLDTLYSKFTFDPLKFMGLDPKDQFDALKMFVKGFDFTQNAAARQDAYERRTAIGREIKRLQALATSTTVPADAPAAAVDESALVAQLEGAGKANAELERRRGARANATAMCAALSADADKACAEAIVLRRRADDLDSLAVAKRAEQLAIEEKIKAAGALPDLVDTAKITEAITAARRSNARFETAQQARAALARTTKEITDCEQISETLSAAIAAADKLKMDAIAAAKLPIDGLTFGDNVVLFKSFPLDVACMADKIRVSVSIAAALAPKLRIARIADGSLLSNSSWELLRQIAIEKDLQIWVETVDSVRPAAVIIEDGRVVKNLNDLDFGSEKTGTSG